MPKYQLLPAQTTPADAAFTRRHTPRNIQDYKEFRRCLRWEFGFTCAICLLHESDIVKYGAEKWGVTQIEHIVPRSHNEKLTGVYTNLLYLCRLCNGARSDTNLVGPGGARLLDPTKNIWSKHFYLKNDELLPLDGDKDAVYTADIYNINDARKVKLRLRRRTDIEEYISEINAQRKHIEHYQHQRGYGEPSAEREAIEGLERSKTSIVRLQKRLVETQWIPDDAPQDCRCDILAARTLPTPYLNQVFPYEIP